MNYNTKSKSNHELILSNFKIWITNKNCIISIFVYQNRDSNRKCYQHWIVSISSECLGE